MLKGREWFLKRIFHLQVWHALIIILLWYVYIHSIMYGGANCEKWNKNWMVSS